ITKLAAYKRLGIENSQLDTLPQVTPLLSQIMHDLAQRGLPSDPMYYLNASADIDARALVKIYYSQWKQVRDALTLEAFCAAAGGDPNSILDSIVNSIARLNALSATVKLSASQSDIVQSTIDAAKDIDNGHKDRRLHMQVSGLMPMPKGSRTVVNVQTNASSSSTTNQAIIVPAPAPEQTVRRLSERLHAVKALPPADKIEDAVLVEED